MVILQNEQVYVEIAEYGAEIRKMTVNGTDVLWNGDPQWWGRVAPTLFPFCGAFRDDTYTYNGKSYPMVKHGYVKDTVFTVETQGADFVTFLHTANDKTLETYPFAYELRITYTLQQTGVEITYAVKNLSAEEMLFSVGSHAGFACPEGVEQYDVVFPKTVSLHSHLVENSLLSHETVTVLENGDVLPLKEDYFAVDALVFKNITFDSCVLRNRQSGKETKVTFPQCEYLLLWQPKGAPFICIEPWCGIPSFVDEEQDLAVKEGLISLPSGKTTVRKQMVTMP